MSLEGHFCWEDCDEGPHGCVCGNECPQPVEEPSHIHAFTHEFLPNMWRCHCGEMMTDERMPIIERRSARPQSLAGERSE